MELFFEDRGHGFPVVFLHGFPLDSKMWRLNSESVRSDGFRTILPDFPGFGQSKGLMTGIPDTARLVLKILDSLNINKAVFCGLSMGGYITFEIARLAKDRIAAAVLCDTTADEDTVEKRKQRRETVKRIKKDGSKTVMEDLARALISPSALNAGSRVAQQITEEFKRADETAVCAALESMATRADSNDIITRMDFPVKLIFGEDDFMLPAGVKMKTAIPHATLDIIPEAGHLPNLEKQSEFDLSLTKFLKDTAI